MSPNTITAVSRRRGGGGGGGGGGTPTTFEQAVLADPLMGSRPTPLATRTVTFTTSAGLASALTGMQAGDLIRYTGVGVLTINAGVAAGYSLSAKNPATAVTIDFGTSRSTWSPSLVSSNYVSFVSTSTSNWSAFTLKNCSRINLFGGDFTTSTQGGVGIIWNGPTHNVYHFDAAVHDVGTSGFGIRPIDNTGAGADIYDFGIRAEVDRFSMNPVHDTHPERGTGCQGCNLHGANTGTGIYGTSPGSTVVAIYGHDPLRPGETSAGQTWPQGGGGDVIEPGNDAGTTYANLTLYAKGVNMLMQAGSTPNNPGSTGNAQVGGNVIEPWGNIPLDGMVIGWVEGSNCTGSCFCGTTVGTWMNASPAIQVLHGRHTNMNQYSVTPQQATVPYDNRFGAHVVYSADCL